MYLKIAIISFISSLLLLICLRPIAIKIKLVDYPDARKQHDGNIPLIGGICILGAIAISYFCFFVPNKFLNILLMTSFLIVIQGILDDFFNLKPITKIVFQALLTYTVFYISDVKLESLGDLAGLPYNSELGYLSIPITIISIVGLVNAINMMDGIDGLSASLVLLTSLSLLFFNIKIETSAIINILLAFVCAIIPFIIFNLTSNNNFKVFLGDGGSLFLGYIISWSLIYSAENINGFNHSSALWCVAVPLYDFFSVIIIRILENRSLVIAERDHIHHMMEALGFTKLMTLLVLVFVSICLIFLGIIIEHKIPELSLIMFIVIFLLYIFIRLHYRNKEKNSVNSSHS